MKYLFIFLPFFAFGQDTIVRGSDTMIIGRSYYDDHSFYKEWTRVGKYKDAFIPSTDSALYGVRNDTMFVTGERFYLNGFESKSFYVSDRKPKVVESFKYAGAYYELRENGWHKELDTDTLIKPRMMEYAPNGGGDGKWKYCDEHLKEGEIGPWRDSSSVNVLIWDGCKLIQKKVDKFENYTYSGDSFFFKNTLQPIQENYSVQYAYKGRLIKFSYVIKEL